MKRVQQRLVLDGKLTDGAYQPLAWVQRPEEADQDDLMVKRPPTAHRRPPTSSAHDVERETTPVTIGPMSPRSNRWRNYLEVSAYPPNTAHSEKVDANWLTQQQDLNSPWLAAHKDPENEDGLGVDTDALFISSKHREIWYRRFYV